MAWGSRAVEHGLNQSVDLLNHRMGPTGGQETAAGGVLNYTSNYTPFSILLLILDASRQVSVDQ